MDSENHCQICQSNTFNLNVLDTEEETFKFLHEHGFFKTNKCEKCSEL